jgi:hypothetical protein
MTEKRFTGSSDPGIIISSPVLPYHGPAHVHQTMGTVQLVVMVLLLQARVHGILGSMDDAAS